jgi:hypothetical protein
MLKPEENTLSVLSEEQGFWMFENRLLMKIFGPKKGCNRAMEKIT